MNDLDFQEWRLRRAKGVIEEYVRGVKRRASDINWVLGVLKGAFGVSKNEALMIIEQIKTIRRSYEILRGWRDLKNLRRELRLRCGSYG